MNTKKEYIQAPNGIEYSRNSFVKKSQEFRFFGGAFVGYSEVRLALGYLTQNLRTIESNDTSSKHQ